MDTNRIISAILCPSLNMQWREWRLRSHIQRLFDISIGLNLNGGISKGIIEIGLLNFTTTLFSSFYKY